MELPKKYRHIESEAKWAAYWEQYGINQWEPGSRDNTFVVDTPPPTVSGSLHIGHVFSYTQTDVVVRFNRMCGKHIFYPMGWDDNGLPTERRVQNVFGIQCNPRLKYDPDLQVQKEANDVREVSRQNFIEACEQLTAEDEQVFEHLWRRLGLSVDWSLQYSTIDDHCRATSQRSFLDLLRKGYIYQIETPAMWDITFKTAVAQAEVEDREKTGFFHDIRFQVETGEEFVIATTRPELLPACIAVVAHPDDERYKPLFGKKAITPLFHAPVPILPADHADPEKGTGILMVCTFGDVMDVEWWKTSGLPIRQVIERNGHMKEVTFGEAPFDSLNPDKANAVYSELTGLFIKKAKSKIVELLQAPGSSVDGSQSALVGEPRQTLQAVKFYEKGDQPLEFITARQWFINILEHRDELLLQGKKIQWHPPHMRTRYDHWVEGLKQDWCISRQRFFGVPFPVWYPLDAQGEPDYGRPIIASEDQLPADPLTQAPPGFDESQRGKPDGFIGDPDVMDTWATSSMTPQIMSQWKIDPDRHDSVFPMDLRPQAHEIIRTWAFYTIAKAWLHETKIPWRHIAISGWILDPDRKKMSKSKGNVVTPESLLDQYSSDAIRYWAAKARLGVDTAYDESVFKIGNRLVTKVFNASKFVLMQLEGADIAQAQDTANITQPLDLSFAKKLQDVIHSATQHFQKFDYATALDEVEESFWNFCDYYVELVKNRTYHRAEHADGISALATLDWALKTYLRLFAPFLPYITEEVWSWRYRVEDSRDQSVHTTQWPQADECPSDSNVNGLYESASLIASKIRGAKTENQKSLKWPVAKLTVSGPESALAHWQYIQSDVIKSGSVDSDQVNLVPKDAELSVEVELADTAS